MARPESTILTSDTGRAQSAAIAVLCVLAGLQLALLGWSAWQVVKHPGEEPGGVQGQDPVVAANGAGEGVPPAGGDLGYLNPPPRPGDLAGMPGAMPGGPPGLMPPLPGMLAGDAPPSVPPGQGAFSSAGLTALPQPDPEVMELLETVAELRATGEMEGLLELLRAAEGMDQTHPAVMKEFALTYEQMGLIEKAREYWRKIVSGGEALGGMHYSLALQRLARLTAAPGAVPAPPGIPAAFGAPLTPPNQVSGIPAVVTPAAGSVGRVTQEPGAQLGVGPCLVVKDMAVAEGDRRMLRIPIVRVKEGQVEPTAVNVDVFFYDRVNEEMVEPTRADPPVSSWVAAPVDWAGAGMEPLDVTYFLPPMSAQEVKDHGRREFYGYLVKLYYQDRLQAVVAEPLDLLEAGPGSAALSSPLPGR